MLSSPTVGRTLANKSRSSYQGCTCTGRAPPAPPGCDLDYGEGSELEARGRQRLSNNLGTTAAPGSTRRRCAFGSEPLSLDG